MFYNEEFTMILYDEERPKLCSIQLRFIVEKSNMTFQDRSGILAHAWGEGGVRGWGQPGKE